MNLLAGLSTGIRPAYDGRFNRWSRRGIWQQIFEACELAGAAEQAALDNTRGESAPFAPVAEKGTLQQAIGVTKGGRRFIGLSTSCPRPSVLNNAADCKVVPACVSLIDGIREL
jgi:hypothetical protein